MTHKAGLIARLFGRSENSVVAKLYTHALGQPLLMHPQLGEQLLGAYLAGAVENTPPQDPIVPGEENAGRIAVINISGGLVNRPMPDICGSGPLSYSVIRSYFDSVMADSNVSAVVLRIDSPGGMAAGCFDLADAIYAARGTKPIVAQIDDSAYSAAYAIAAACDRIQVSRTGGGGSIGVFTYHIDVTGANAMAGVKVDYIYAGDKKLDGSPDMPLGKYARADMQASVDSIYNLFVSSVAKYRGVSVASVQATQAGCYSGQALVAAGLADSVGTLENLLVELSGPATSKPSVPAGAENGDEIMPDPTETPEAKAAAAKAAADLLAADESAKVKLAARTAYTNALVTSDLPAIIVKAMLDPKIADTVATAEEIPKRVENATKISDMCKAAGLESCAADFISAGTDPEAARIALQAAKADVADEIVTALPVAGKTAAEARKESLDPTAIYQNRNSQQSTKGKAK